MKIKFFTIFIIFLSVLLAQKAIAAPNYSYSTPESYDYTKNTNVDNNNEKILFIVDFSNSMNEKLGYSSKLEIALNTMQEILQMLPKQASIGLRVYGHRTGFTPRQSCSASQLVTPISQNNAVNVYSTLKSINAVGWTPITYSLKQATFFDFGDFQGKKRIVLISDGGENCDESPCDFVIELMKHRDDISIDVIALAVGDNDANNQLKCVALVTSGKFYNANTAAELKNSLQDSLRLQKDVQGIILNK